MSFLNPASEPVKRFSSTDASAPQINYNARVAGDVKTVLKACLVTGYGAKASAGWSIVNEVDHVAEFVSPSTAMIDYRLGIGDSAATKTDWYYQFQDARVNPSNNAPTKAFTNANKTSVSNGWQLLVTDRGFIFIESVLHTINNKLSSRLLYFGQTKSMLANDSGKNMLFFNIGHNASASRPDGLFSASYPSFAMGSYTDGRIHSLAPVPSSASLLLGASTVDIISDVYVVTSASTGFLSQVSGLMRISISNPSDLYGVSERVVDGRYTLDICAGYSTSSLDQTEGFALTFLVYLDYWGY